MMNKLTQLQQDHLLMMQRELVNVSQVITNIIQYGYDINESNNGMDNRKALEYVCGDVEYHIERLCLEGNLDRKGVDTRKESRLESDPSLKKECLFTLSSGQQVFDGDKLYHPDPRMTLGQPLKAEFKEEGGWVTVRHPNGAVPRLRVCELKMWDDREARPVLFKLEDGSPIRKGDKLYNRHFRMDNDEYRMLTALYEPCAAGDMVIVDGKPTNNPELYVTLAFDDKKSVTSKISNLKQWWSNDEI